MTLITKLNAIGEWSPIQEVYVLPTINRSDCSNISATRLFELLTYNPHSPAYTGKYRILNDFIISRSIIFHHASLTIYGMVLINAKIYYKRIPDKQGFNNALIPIYKNEYKIIIAEEIENLCQVDFKAHQRFMNYSYEVMPLHRIQRYVGTFDDDMFDADSKFKKKLLKNVAGYLEYEQASIPF